MLLSTNDKRTYLHVTLANGLRVLLVNDTACRKSAAAACIQGGHFDDPKHIPGLAHLLEHMLFNGSETYPEADNLDKYLSPHSGSANAWTGTEFSNYHFDVTHSHFLEGLQRFADMLFKPLFTQAAIEKEIAAIEAEFQLKIHDDLRRLYQVHKETCNPNHPFSKFSVGNQDTFSAHSLASIQTALIKMHEKHYIPNNMTLCIVSEMPLEEQKKCVEQTFSLFDSGQDFQRPTLPPLYLPEQLGVKINIKPIKDARRLIVSFALPDMQHYNASKPLEFISHLLGDEGNGSLLNHYKRLNWAMNLSAGGGINGNGFKDFNVNLQLTKCGEDNISGILNSLFYYINLIAEQGLETWRVKEKAILGKLAFEHIENAKPLDEAMQFSNLMFHYQDTDILSGDYLITDYSFHPIKTCLSFMSPRNMRLKLISKDLHTNKVASWYETPYAIEPIEQDLLTALSSPRAVEDLHLPSPNPYITESCTLVTTNEKYLLPSKILHNENLQVWFAQDSQFSQPKGDCFISFDCEAVTQGIKVSAYKRLWVALMVEHLNDQFYHAGVAGLHYHLYAHQGGFSIHTNGYSHNQLELSLNILNQIMENVDLQPLFEQVKQKQLKNLQNSLLNKPINRLFARLSGLIQRFTYAPLELLPIVENATLEDIYWLKSQLFKQYSVEAFVFGNWTLAQSKQFASRLDNLPKPTLPLTQIKREVVDLKNVIHYENQVSSQHPDSAVVLYLQTPSADTKDVALTILVEQLLASPFFHEIRNEKQLGYLVGSGYLPLNQHPGMVFYAQSPNYSANHILAEIKTFLNEITSSIDDYQEVWSHVRTSVSKQLEGSDTNLTAKAQRLWLAIGNQDLEFNLQKAIANALFKLTFDDIKNFCQKLIAPADVGTLVLYCCGNKNEPDDIPAQGQAIKDLTAFKQQATYII
ncbi:insulinase family protein [Aliiglaciecola sp. 3_MG-2023]|uniref:insulinase family protein n=1 Tax=Aliiglaciecola sp. 3_MG-2023 TaxID=3062644 RepID=UPI0026E36AAB|nr:insulinase family protein [Aliiglaciecola sp. 3_MG-2023]MDO6691685.1 insulinase family protein [Aliiglaciecola sp. 3_MG-2023]